MRWMIAVLLAACGGATAAQPTTPRSRATVTDLAWLAGTWHSPMLDSHWENVAGALYGIALDGHGFEVNIIDGTDGEGRLAPIALVALENGRDAMRFTLATVTPTLIVFEDPQHRVVRVTKTVRGWRGEFTDDPNRHPTVFTMEPGTLVAAPELADADRQFAADTAKDGADGWARWFAPDGALWRGDARVEGAAIREQIAKTLSRGALTWVPVSNGRRGDIGFTLGTWTFANGADRGSYATIWRVQPDGSWKIVFDIGRPMLKQWKEIDRTATPGRAQVPAADGLKQ